MTSRPASRPATSSASDFSRPTVIRRLRYRLLQSSWPRAQMLLIVSLTAGAGLLSSLLLLSGGLTAMGPRYALSVAIAYLVFLGLLWLWLRSDSSDYVDFPNVPSSSSSSTHSHNSESCAPGSDANLPSRVSFDDASSSSEGFGESLGQSLGDAVGASDEAAIPLLLLLILLAVLASVLVVIGSVVWSAPALFAELLFDGVLAAGLYRRMRRSDAQHWLQTALRHTFFPFLLTLLLVAGAGFALQHFTPEATTLSQALG